MGNETVVEGVVIVDMSFVEGVVRVDMTVVVVVVVVATVGSFFPKAPSYLLLPGFYGTVSGEMFYKITFLVKTILKTLLSFFGKNCFFLKLSCLCLSICITLCMLCL